MGFPAVQLHPRDFPSIITSGPPVEDGRDLTICIKGAYACPGLLTTGVCTLDNLGGSSEHRAEY